MKKIIVPLLAFCLLNISCMSTDLVVAEYEIDTGKLSESITIALVADLHSCDYGEGQKELINAIERYKPDFITLAGDIVDDILPWENAEEFFREITQTYTCYYVSGNHEYFSNDIANIKNMIASYGIHILEGDTIHIQINGETISLSGIDDPEVGEAEFANQLEASAQEINPNQLSILLTHRPERIEQYLPYQFDLILAGHTHGGQWRIPGILNGLYAPGQGLFPKYAGGEYQIEESTMIVSRGLARENTKIPRIYNPPELVIITVF